VEGVEDGGEASDLLGEGVEFKLKLALVGAGDGVALFGVFNFLVKVKHKGKVKR
jgi:hypothetical protein